jgi:hypothetical protein
LRFLESFFKYSNKMSRDDKDDDKYIGSDVKNL